MKVVVAVEDNDQIRVQVHKPVGNKHQLLKRHVRTTPGIDHLQAQAELALRKGLELRGKRR